jgi:hypothetical protein
MASMIPQDGNDLMTTIDHATAPTKSDLADTVSRIAVELGEDPAAALDCIDAIRKINHLRPLPPELSTELLVWTENKDVRGHVFRWDALSIAGRYSIFTEDEGFRWGLESVTQLIDATSPEAAMVVVREDLEARIRAMLRAMPNKLSWQNFDRDSRVTSRTAAYRVVQIDIGEGLDEWMITLHGQEPTTEIFPTREAAKAYVHAHWMRENLTLFALPDTSTSAIQTTKGRREHE